MKFALLGKGKTGKLLAGGAARVFDRQRPPNAEELRGMDAVISFLPGAAFNDYIPALLQTALPVAVGGTGAPLPEDLDKTLKSRRLSWIWGHNFAPGMAPAKAVLRILGGTDYERRIEEIHHSAKRDAPSGTALKWRLWAGDEEVEIRSERTGDVPGEHRFICQNDSERITFTHQTLDRRAFAQGALRAARRLCERPPLGYGLHRFEDVFR